MSIYSADVFKTQTPRTPDSLQSFGDAQKGEKIIVPNVVRQVVEEFKLGEERTSEAVSHFVELINNGKIQIDARDILGYKEKVRALVNRYLNYTEN